MQLGANHPKRLSIPGAFESLDRLVSLERALTGCGDQLALLLVYERPSQISQRPDLARTFFAERCVSDAQLERMANAFRSIGAYVELFEGELPFLRALADGRLERLGRPLKIAYNGVGFGVTPGGYEPGRMALIPAVSDAYAIVCANSDAYTCSLALHRFHSFVVLRALGVQAPPVWHFRPGKGWMGEPPPRGTKLIAKSTYEAWSVGVTERSVFVVDGTCERRLAEIADDIGQAVTVQEFVSGREVCVPIVAFPDAVVLPLVEQILVKAPGDPDAVRTIDDNLNNNAVTYVPFDGAHELCESMRRTAMNVFDILQLRALGRMDFRIDSCGVPWLTDVAVTPGLGATGSTYASISQHGVDHATFIRMIVAATLGTRGLLPED